MLRCSAGYRKKTLWYYSPNAFTIRFKVQKTLPRFLNCTAVIVCSWWRSTSFNFKWKITTEDYLQRDKRLGEKSPRFPAFDYFCVLAIEHEDWYYCKDNNSKSIWGCFQLQDSFGFPSGEYWVSIFIVRFFCLWQTRKWGSLLICSWLMMDDAVGIIFSLFLKTFLATMSHNLSSQDQIHRESFLCN